MINDTTSANSLTVVHIISGLGQGGAETVLYRLVTHAPSQTKHIVISLGDMGIFGPRLVQAGIEVHALHMKALNVLPKFLLLRRLLKSLRPDVVQTWMYNADLVGGLAARFSGIATVAWNIRNSGENLHHSSLKARAVAWLCARLSGVMPALIVACADNAARRHKRWGYKAEKMLVIPNGYTLSQWTPDPEKALGIYQELGIEPSIPLLSSVARWNPLKDHPNLLAALARLKRMQPGEWRCLLVGEGLDGDNTELMHLIQHFDLNDRVILMGRREDVPAIMAATDIHVLSSKAEGFPNVVCEAIVSKALCVVTDVGDAAKIVGAEGIVVPPSNAEALAQGMEKALALLTSPDLANRLEVAAARIAKVYSVETMVQNYERAWQDMQQTTTSSPLSRGEKEGPILLFVVNNPAFFLSHRLPLAQAAQQAGFNVHVATMNGPTVARIRSLGFIHHALPLSRSGKNPLAELRSLWAMYRLFKSLKPQVVHAVTIKPVIYGGIAARMAGVPGFLAAISGLGYLFTSERNGLVKRIALRLYKFALGHPHSRVVFQNTSDRDVLLSAGVVREEQSVLIRGSGVDLEMFSYEPEHTGTPVALMVSRLLIDKGVNEFIAAAQISQQRGSPVIWQIAGSPDPGNPGSLTREQITSWHQTGVIEWLGEQTDVAALYKKSHIAVLPSYREGLPKSLIEAAAVGRPVVTTDVPGCRDAIEVDVTGVLVPVQNALALANAVLDLANDTERRQQMGRASRDLAERAFDINTVIDTHLRLYGYLAKRKK